MGVMDQRACKKLCESIATMAEKAAAAADSEQQLHAGLQLYAVLASYCMDNAERVSVVCMCYYMMLASLDDSSTKWQDLLLKFMSERDGSLRALLGNEAPAPLVSDKFAKDVHKQLLRSNVLSEHALQQWPTEVADGLRASAAKLMSTGSFRTVLECERMSWNVMLAPFEEDGTEATVQGSMRALVQRVMGDYERLADWCGSAAAAAQDEQQPVKLTKDPPIGADVFVDDLGSRDADLRSSSAKEYDQRILQDDVQDRSLSSKKLAIVYGFDCMRYLHYHAAFALSTRPLLLSCRCSMDL